jgi:hypothetical protein
MSEHEYQELWHYSERFTTDRLQRSELVTMAWKEGERLGSRRSLGLMKSIMHFRSKELNKRSAFPCDEVGKSTQEVWNRTQKILLGRPYRNDPESRTLEEFLLPDKITPLNYTIANDFLGALDEDERKLLNDLIAGHKLKDIAKRNRLSASRLAMLRQAVRDKAATYL